jgi:hypothetical protein
VKKLVSDPVSVMASDALSPENLVVPLAETASPTITADRWLNAAFHRFALLDPQVTPRAT